MERLNPGFLGSFAAVMPMRQFDVDGDGKVKNVYLSAKTDIRAIQSNASGTPMFRDALLNLEVGLYGTRELIVYYGTRPLKERPVTIHLANGETPEYTTDGEGIVKGLSVKEIRNGVTVQYTPNAKNTYLMRYTPETASVISAAIRPIINLTVLTAAGIALCVFLRGRLRKKDPILRCVSGGKGGRVRAGSKPRSVFMLIRWAVMLLSFFALTWGGSLIGYWFENITPPIFACGRYNPEQLTGSACYYLSHLNLLKDLPIGQVVIFALSFLIPLVIFGRVLCGFVCPMGLVQDGLDEARQAARAGGIAMNDKLRGRLAVIKWVFVMLFLTMCFAGLDFCNVCPVLTLSPGFSGFKTSVYIGGFLMIFALVGSFFKRRFFCAVCPLGLIMGLFYKASLFRLKKDCTACTECGACYAACPMSIKEIYTEREKRDVTSINCIMCGECVRQCPEDNALCITFCGRRVYAASREKFMLQYREREKANVK
jgi:ferredoxin